jgi:hypothetical protein
MEGNGKGVLWWWRLEGRFLRTYIWKFRREKGRGRERKERN